MYKYFFKRVFDIVIGIVAFPFICLLIIVLGPIIWFEDKGPIFYNAKRIGKNGKLFKMYKFRSMKVNAPDIRLEDGSTFNSEDDSRVTKIGRFLRKTSLDEFPQFLNVLFGQMSLIGPRPDLPSDLDFYDADERQILYVRPGITGYNQALNRNSVGTKEKLQNDIYYVKNLSFALDVKIIFLTVKSILFAKNVYRSTGTGN